MNIRVLNHDDYHLVAWRNRNGISTELYMEPPDGYLGGFDWRITRSIVDAKGQFSYFVGVDRTIAVISGILVLHVENGAPITLTKESAPFEFKGEWTVHNGEPYEELITFHALSNRKKCTHKVSAGRIIPNVAQTMRVKCHVIALYHAGGLDIDVECDGQSVRLAFGKTLIISGLDSDIYHKLRLHGESAKYYLTEVTFTGSNFSS